MTASTNSRPASPISVRRRGVRVELSVLAGFLFLGVVVPVLVGAIAGSLEIPRNDDWTYRRIALELASTGRLALEGASRPLIVGQILFTQPFLWVSRLQPWAFAATGVLFAVGAVLSAWVMARQVLPTRLASVPVLLLLLFPGYLAYATSYMTDVPAMAAVFTCLALGALALARRPVPTRWLLGSVVVGFLAFSIRDVAVAAPASVVLAAICAEPRRVRTWVIGIALAGCCAGLYLWSTTLPGQFGEANTYPNGVGRVIQTLFSASLVVVPAAVIAAALWRDHWRRFDVVVGAEIGLLLVAMRLLSLLTDGTMPPIILYNLMSPWGAPERNILTGGRPTLFADPGWVAIGVLALISIVIVFAVGAGIAGVHLRRWRASPRPRIDRMGSPQGAFLLFLVSTAAGLTLFGLSYSLFDRYLWPIVPTLAILLLYVPSDLRAPSATRDHGAGVSHSSTATHAGAAFAGTVLALMAIVYLLNAHAFDVGRWRAGEALVRLGVPTDQIDAGYEWMGYHATSLATVPSPGSGPTTYRELWPSFVLCGLVSSTPQAGGTGEFVGTVSYELNLVAGPTETLYLFRFSKPDCRVPAN